MKTSTSMAAGWGHPHVTALLSLHLNPNHLGGLMCEMGERFVFWPNGLVGLNDGMPAISSVLGSCVPGHRNSSRAMHACVLRR